VNGLDVYMDKKAVTIYKKPKRVLCVTDKHYKHKYNLTVYHYVVVLLSITVLDILCINNDET
jgi:hypothetical protein